jgi:hypothetical protein
MSRNNIVPAELIESKILLIRGQKVILDKDLAMLYDVQTRDLNKAVSRNKERFPKDFMFQLGRNELSNLMFHFGTSSWWGTRKLPYVFTEQGIAMLSSILRSDRAIQVNIMIMRTFVKLREIITTHTELAQRLKELELKMETQDEQITAIFEAINQLLAPPDNAKRKIGFVVEEKRVKYKATEHWWHGK